MSYLHPPRLHFAGQFQADPPTVNNDPRYYDADNFQPRFQQLDAAGGTNGRWNPRGSGAWRFLGCTVRRAVYRDGTSCTDPVADTIIGATISGTDAKAAAKLVDLDPQQQMVSEIWGLQINLNAGARGALVPFFSSDFEASPFADIWVRRPQGVKQAKYGAFYQSVLTVLRAQAGTSRLLGEILEAGTARLSIRLNVDGFDDDVPGSSTFGFGRVTGSIGLYSTDEPARFVAGRALAPTTGSPLSVAYGQIRDNVLWLDLGNSIPAAPDGTLLLLQAPLCAAVLPPDAPPVALGEIDCTGPGWYETTSGIVAIPLSAEQVALAEKNPLAIMQGVALQPLLAEAGHGLFVRADQFVFRFNPPETQTAVLYATQFGKPASGATISLLHDSFNVLRQAGKGPRPGVPEDALKFPASVVTNEVGVATVAIEASDPGNPRGYIDGQVYGIAYGPGEAPPATGNHNSSRCLNALVFSRYEAQDEPTWLEDVEPIFQQYDNLYPSMRAVVELSNYASVVSRLPILQRAFEVDIPDPGYMPVTRDLSRPKRDMIRKWLHGLDRLGQPLYMRLDSVQDLKQALQLAVELEHSTIPPYLCALYSLKEGANTDVYDILREVVTQEMAHMAHVANLLIAIGCAPRLGDPGFVPRYPGPLPGGLRGGLTVRLRRCSIKQIRDVFMSIEEPETIQEPAGEDGFQRHVPYTIGWFYDEIGRSIEDLSDKGLLHFGDGKKQVTYKAGPNPVKPVTSVHEALAALQSIKQQGESCLPLHIAHAGDEFGHYYRFREIVEGRRIVFSPDRKKFSYTGEPISFDPEDVWPIVDDPDLTCYPAGSRAAILAAQFAATYQALLRGLNRAFNGDPDYLQEALSLMFSLNVAARELVQTPSGRGDGTTAGPVFQ